MAALFYLVAYVLLVLSPLALILLTVPVTDHGTLYELGKAFALMGFVIIVMQFILSSRIKRIERHYGLDIVFRWHRAMAVLAGVLILCHPVLLAAGSGDYQLLTSFSLPWFILLGKAGLLLVILQVCISMFRSSLHLEFETWRYFHNAAAGLLLAGVFVHSVLASHTDLKSDALSALWIVLPALGLVLYGYHKWILPAKLKKQPYTVRDVRQETHNVWTVEMVPPENLKRFNYLPGQFHFITLHRNRHLPEEEHHFTISSSPAQKDVLASTIKESGDFTSTIGKTKKGDTVSVEGPFGRFSHVLHPDDSDFVFIAGGIGITPFMSMLRTMNAAEDTSSVLLIYANHTEEDIVFKEELDDIAARGFPRLKTVYVLNQPHPAWTGETGIVNHEIITKYVGEVQDKTFYICCPPAMRKAMLKLLRLNGVDTSRIRLEIFSL